MMNANSLSEEVLISSNQTTEFVDDLGCRSECNSDARAGALAFATDLEDRSVNGELYALWRDFYGACVAARGC